MLRERLVASIKSRSTITIFETPSSARFLRISFPSAPAPMTSTLAERSFSWSHHPMSRKRLKRSSAAVEPLFIVNLQLFRAEDGECPRLLLLPRRESAHPAPGVRNSCDGTCNSAERRQDR